MTAIVVIFLVLAFVVVVCKILIADARRSKKIAQSEHVAEVSHTKDLAEYDDPYGISMDNYYDIDNEPDLYDDYDDGDDDRYLAAREEEQAAYDDFIASMDMND